MKKSVLLISMVTSGMFLCNCTGKDASKKTETDNLPTVSSVQVDGKVSGVECDVTISDIHFTKSVNNAHSLITAVGNNKVVFTTGEKTDYFSDPNGKLSNTTAPILLTSVDNTKPFTFTAKVTPDFSSNDFYNAGVLYVYSNDGFFQKLCYEQDEREKHRVVTVRTIGSSDDSNHDIIEQPYVYMKISSDGETIASYYSLDNETWQMVRLYENNYPNEIWLGISSQCPIGKGMKSIFEELVLEKKSVADFRLGI
jgi:regulation of enolase protein 1 (concanavalin A-like superfamily)